MGWACNTHGSDTKYTVLTIKPEGEASLWRPEHRLEDNFKADRKEREYQSVEWSLLAQGKVSCEHVLHSKCGIS
jgi:hypothetical protein